MIDDTRVISKMLAFGLTGITVFYATMTTLQLASGAPPVHQWWFAYPFECFSCFFAIPVLMFLATRYEWAKLPAIVYFHVTTVIVSVWFTEVYSPFTVVWTMYTLVASIYYGWKGFIGSTVALFIYAGWYVIGFAGDLKPSFGVYATLAVLVCTITTCTSFLFVKVVKSGQNKNQALQNSQLLEKMRANQLNALLNSIREPVLTIDDQGNITSQNSASQGFFDSNEPFVGKNIDELLQLRTRDNAAIKVSELAKSLTTTMEREDLIQGTGPTARYLSLQLARIERVFEETPDKQAMSGLVVMIRDITKQKTLEDEKDEFISVTSHELRTPIAIIEGGISNIELFRTRHIDDQRFDIAISTAHEQILNLSRIVNDISTISRAEKGDGDKVEEIDFAQLLMEVQNKYKAEAEQKSLALRLEIPENMPHLVTSRLYVSEVIENFIKNGIKYTKAGGVTIKAGIITDGRVFCDVIDTGIGINEADQTRIFEKFYRSEDYRTRETSGTGLGLYEAKILATKLDAEIRVASKLNTGSVFRLILPLNAMKFEISNVKAHHVELQSAVEA